MGPHLYLPSLSLQDDLECWLLRNTGPTRKNPFLEKALNTSRSSLAPTLEVLWKPRVCIKAMLCFWEEALWLQTDSEMALWLTYLPVIRASPETLQRRSYVAHLFRKSTSFSQSIPLLRYCRKNYLEDLTGMLTQAKLVLQPAFFFFKVPCKHKYFSSKVNYSKYVHKNPQNTYTNRIFLFCFFQLPCFQSHDVKEKSIFLFQPQIAGNEGCPNLWSGTNLFNEEIPGIKYLDFRIF